MKSTRVGNDLSKQLELVEAVYHDACDLCTADSDLRDLMTIRARVKEEGLSFLTITLPEFSKGIERCLELGFMDSKYFRSFAKVGSIPAFLQGMTSRIFDQETGRCYEFNSVTPILVAAIRQVCLLYKKVALPCTPERERAAVESFVQIEQANKSLDVQVDPHFTAVARVLWDPLLGNLRLSELVPKHGPGAVAERLLGNQKYLWRFWSERLEPFFPFVGTAYANSVAADEEWRIEEVTFQPIGSETPVRVVTVPKTLKAPRVIAIEPAHNQYVQQAVKSWLYQQLETYKLTRGHVNFTDQTINQLLALTSSRNGWGATLDMSEASDRVLNAYARCLFDRYPDVDEAIQACRSTHAQLPDGRVIGPLLKFASMGSALCFPVEAMVFYTACVAAILRRHNLPVSRKSVFEASRDVYVYGDDLIIRVEEAEAVRDYLHEIHCKVNDSKTFVAGNFRESCGVDAFNGIEVTPTYLRTVAPASRREAHSIASWVSTGNAFFLKGYFRTAALMLSTVEALIGSLPFRESDPGHLYRYGSGPVRSANRWNGDTQRLEIRAWVLDSVKCSDHLDGHPALAKCLLGLELRNSVPDSLRGRFVPWGALPLEEDDRHLEQSELRGSVTLKNRWVPYT